MKRGRFSLSREERISHSSDYKRIFKEGKRLRFPEFTLIVAKNNLPYSRIGLSVGRRFGKAVKRNRAKRLCRELFRLNKYKIPTGVDIVFVPRQPILKSGWQNLMQRMEEAGRLIERKV